MNREKKKKWILVVLLGIGCIFILFPLAWMVSTAFKPSAEALNGRLIPSHFTLDNFAQILGTQSAAYVLRWLGNSIFVSFAASVLVVILDSMAAYALARLEFFGRKLLFYAVVSSLMIPFIGLLIPWYLEFSNTGLLDTYWALILPYTGNAFGVFLLYQFFLGIPKDLEEAAIIDGANKWTIWTRVCVPLSVTPTVTLGLLTFMNVYNDFFWPLVASTSKPMLTMTVGVANMAVGEYNTNYSLLMALTIFSVIPMLIAFLFAQRQLRQGIATTGIK